MDAGSPGVIAAAPGVVTRAEDGHYDRCHGTLEGVDCDGGDGVANAVVLTHRDGMQSWYWHLQRDSVAVVQGQWVERGALLGRIGSSGNSSMPHLHFEVVSPEGEVVDPYVDPATGAESWWCDQGPEDALPGPCL
jgi:murein DD-endopeptidase MepM/ murein hydrolase activator NlpD